MTWTPGKPKPKELRMFYDVLPAVKGDQTLEAYDQFIRFDWLVKKKGALPKLQLCLDRRHLRDRTKSKPFGYITISDPTQLHQFAINALVALLIHSRSAAPPAGFAFEEALENWVKLVEPTLRRAVDQVWEELNPPRQATLDWV